MSKKNAVVRKQINPNGRYTEASAKQKIVSAGGNIGVNTVSHPSPGIKVLGAIDFLVNYCGFVKEV